MSVRRALLVLGCAAAACTFSNEYVIAPHVVTKTPMESDVARFNLENRLSLGYIPEVLRYFQTVPRHGSTIGLTDSTQTARLYGQAQLEAGDFVSATAHLERAYGEEGRFTERAETAWQLSQARYWLDDFEGAARWGKLARDAGYGLPDGWVKFLASCGERQPYAGVATGAHVKTAMGFGRPDLPRFPVRVNDRPPEVMILDSGASMSLVTESAAKRLGLEMVPDATAGAYGLHRVRITMTFGWAKSVQFGGVTLENVPFGVLPDGALTFETTKASGFTFDGVLGVHLMKEFDWKLIYREKQVEAIRLDPKAKRGSRSQNVFFRRLKPMVRTSFNQEGWFLFLLDTGSEPTMVTRDAIHRSTSKENAGIYPMTIEGIGNSRVSWSKMSDVTIGLDRWMVKFKDVVVKEESEGIEDGVVGTSFLGNFDTELRFSAMTLRLDRPIERRLRELEASDKERAAAGGS
jgi:predicted aspartyl protease